MSFSLDTYQSNRQSLLGTLEEFHDLLNEMMLDVEMRKVNELQASILEEQFQVVVVGEFSRGKSTFINALLGKKILPSSAKPTTTILNKITYGNEPSISLHFHDSMQKPAKISEEQFAKLVAPKEPIPGEADSEKQYEKQVEFLQKISHAEIAHPLSFSQNGVEIIDTPGTNDLDPAREEITNNIIPKSDAAILILSAIKILSESELSFLRDRLLANDIQKIFIVVNFKDQLESEEDERKVLDFAYKHLKDVLHEPKIYMVAAKHALNARRKENGEELVTKRGKPIPVWNLQETGFLELEQSLADFLQFERGAVKLQKPIQRTIKNIKDVKKKYVGLEKSALSQRMDGLQEKVEAFRPKLREVQEIGKDALKNIALELRKQEDELVRWYEREVQGITAKGLQTFEEYRHLSVNDISRKVENSIAPLERELHLKKKEKMTAIAKNCVTKMTQKVNQEWLKLEDELLNLGKAQTEDGLLPAAIEYEEEYEYSLFDEIFEELDDAWSKSNSLLGKVAIGAGYVATAVVGGLTALFKAGWSWLTGENEKTKFKRNLADQFDSSKKRKVSSFKREWKGLMDGIYKQYKTIVDRNVEQMEEQLNHLIKTTQLEEKEIQRMFEILNRRETKLERLESELKTLSDRIHQQTKDKVGVL
ncbi:MAG: dynamin family protein [Bacillota bacterium]